MTNPLIKNKTLFLKRKDFHKIYKKQNHKWYSLIVLPTYEKNVINHLIEISKRKKFKHLISEVKVILDFAEEKIKIKKEYRQYIFIKMKLTSTTYQAVQVSGVRTFIFDKNGFPATIEEKEIKKILTY